MPVAKSRGPKAFRIEPSRLLDAAQAVFCREGLQGASVRAISREAGCDPSLLYYHFESKEAMFTALLDRKFPPLVERFMGALESGEGRPAAERLWEFLGIVHEQMSADPGFRSLVRGELVRGAEGIQNAIAERIKPVFRILLEVFRAGVAEGEIRADLPTPLGGFFFLRLYMEILDLVPVMSMRIVGIPPEKVLPLVRFSWFDLFWRGIAARPDEPLPFLEPHRTALRVAVGELQQAYGSFP